MKAFAYVTARSPESAARLAGDDGRYFAGGIDLLGEMKEYLATPRTLVNVKALPGSRDLVFAGGLCSLGASVTLAEVAADPRVAASLPGLAEAAAGVGSPQIRNIATVGGNLAQHSRCWYYRHRDVRCRKKGGQKCFARVGESKYHSLFTGCLCVSPLVSNLAVALAALDARVCVFRAGRTERLTVAELYSGAWSNPLAHNSLKPGDLIVRIEVPAPPGARSAYLQVSEKSDFDWALVSCSAAARVSGRTLSRARVVLGAVAPVPWQAADAERLLEGRALDAGLAERAADAILAGAAPLEGNGYKLPIARALIRRSLLKLIA
jgi:xanthine dehydrogenase YagS FAD-binding subunit